METNVRYFDAEIQNVTSRTDEVKKNSMFVCIKGMRRDGHEFASVAKDRGASVLVVEEITHEVVFSGLPYIRVQNTRSVLPVLCAKSYGNPEKELKIYAVTGTNGKTSTVTLLKGIFESTGKNVVAFGTLDGNLTTPDPEDLFLNFSRAFASGKSCVVMEASSHSLGLDKLNGIEFEGAIFTNLTPEHLDFHKNMENYGNEKSKLFSHSRVSIFNSDDEYCSLVDSKCKGEKYYYSFSDCISDYYIRKYVEHSVRGIEYVMQSPKGDVHIKSALVGRFNAYNTMAASALAISCGVDIKDVENAVGKINSVCGRLEKIDVGQLPFTVYIDYAHSPDALEKVLQTIRGFKDKSQKLTVLFGCGGDRDRSKRKVMGQIASRLADFVIVTGDNSRTEKTADIINEIMKGIDKERPYTVIESRESAIRYAIEQATDGEIILLAGKGHENYEIVGYDKIHFSEKDIVRKAILERFKG